MASGNSQEISDNGNPDSMGFFKKLDMEKIKKIIDGKSNYETITRVEFSRLIKRFGLEVKDFHTAMGKEERYFDFLNKDGKSPDLEQSEAFYFCYVIRTIMYEEIRERIKDFVREAFKKIRCEVITVWNVRVRNKVVLFRDREDRVRYKCRPVKECILLDNTMYKFDFEKNKPDFFPYRDDIRSLEVESLTSYPLLTPENLNLWGNGIKEHDAKRFKEHRNADYLSNKGQLESLLRIYATDKDFERTETRPYFLLSFENKLRFDNSGIASVILEPEKDSKTIFTYEDLEIALELKKEMLKKLKKYLIIAFHEDISLLDWVKMLKPD